MVSRLLAMNPGTATAPLDGIPTTEPAFGLPALWIPESARAEAEMAGYTVIDPTSVIATHLTEIIKSHAPDLLGRQETSALLDNVKSHYPVVVEELVPGMLTVGEIQRVLQSLLARTHSDSKPHSDPRNASRLGTRQQRHRLPHRKSPRGALARHISAEYAENGLLSVITVDPRLEALLAEAVRRGEDAYALLDPNTVAKVYGSLTQADRRCAERGFATDRPLLAVGALGAQTPDRTGRAATRRAVVFGDSAGTQGRVHRPDLDHGRCGAGRNSGALTETLGCRCSRRFSGASRPSHRGSCPSRTPSSTWSSAAASPGRLRSSRLARAASSRATCSVAPAKPP